ncbi:MAG: PAS domain S-box protein [Candidatus Bathyarchaeota archaeon]|nr:PAS domain S-box protein [Candidatus Bathyarchaeota archaeon]
MQLKVNDLSALYFSKQNSENKYKQLFEEAIDAIIIIGSESDVILECNQAAAELFERTKDELIGEHEAILYPFEETANSLTTLFREKKAHSPNLKKYEIQTETKVITKNEQIKDVSIHAYSMDIEGKEIIYASFRDVTQQKQAEAALRYSAEQFSILAETWPNMIVIIQDGKVAYLNQETVRVTGYSKEEFYSPDFDLTKLLSPEFLPEFMEEFDKRIKGLSLEPLEFTLITKKGSTIDAIWSARPITFNGKLGLVGVATDITERKKNEQLIITQKNQLEGIFASSPDAITVTDLSGNILHCNQAAVSLIGLNSKEEAIGKNIRQLISPKDQQKAYMDLAKVMETGVPVKNLELVFLTKDGKELPVELSGAAIKDASGKPVNLVTITHDISERKEMQQKLQQERDILNAVTRSINAGFVMVSRNYEIVWTNEFIKGLFGSAEGKLCYQALHGHKSKSICSDYSVRKVFEDNANEASHEIQITGAEGKKVWMKIAAAPIKDAEGQVVAAAELVVDITDIRQAEEQIRLLSSVVEQEVDGIAVSDNQGRILFLNKSWITMHELADGAEDLTGESIMRFYDPDQLKAIGSKTDNDGVFRGRLKQITKDGTGFTALATLSPLRDKEGQIVGTIHTAKKLTEIVREIRNVGSHSYRGDSAVDGV